MTIPTDYQAGPFGSEGEFQAFKSAEESEASGKDYAVDVEHIVANGSVYASVTYTTAPTAAAAASGMTTAVGALTGAAAGGAVGAALGGPVGAAIGAALGATAGAAAGTAAAGWTLGTLSRKYEVSNKGPGVVSPGTGDAGGASYGLFQMTSIPSGGTVARFVAGLPANYAAKFKGLTPGGAVFTQAWKDLAAADPVGFSAAQEAYIGQTHYDPMVHAIKAATGLDVPARSHALQDVVWSTAVQHGPGASIVTDCCRNVINAGAVSPDQGVAFDRVLIPAVYAERGRRDASGNLVYFSKNSPAVQQGVASRFVHECADALRMLDS